MKRALIIMSLALTALGGSYALDQLQNVGEAQAQPIALDAGVDPMPDATAGSGSGSQTPAPHETIPNPTEDPGGFYQALREAFKKGWAGFVLLVIYGLVRLVGLASKKIPKLAWLNSGNVAMGIAAVGTIVESGIDALFLGGTLGGVLVAMLWALIGLYSPAADKPKKV